MYTAVKVFVAALQVASILENLQIDVNSPEKLFFRPCYADIIRKYTEGHYAEATTFGAN